LILYGNAPLEENSFVPDSIQDVTRFRYIMKNCGSLKKKKINDFLIYPQMNYWWIAWKKRTGQLGRELSPLFYLPNPTDHEMGEIIKRTLEWEDDDTRSYTKHLDCWAEPATNYIRHHIYGYERHLCQYSNMIRRGEVSRETALEMYGKDAVESIPEGMDRLLTYLKINDQDLKLILQTEPLKYERQTSFSNRIFAMVMKYR
jgi:hypothetical protein